jgi:uncharacterized ubiquitin-like protein YukD
VVVIRFADIGGIVDHHCLNFLFVTIIFRNYNSEIINIRIKQYNPDKPRLYIVVIEKKQRIKLNDLSSTTSSIFFKTIKDSIISI